MRPAAVASPCPRWRSSAPAVPAARSRAPREPPGVEVTLAGRDDAARCLPRVRDRAPLRARFRDRRRPPRSRPRRSRRFGSSATRAAPPGSTRSPPPGAREPACSRCIRSRRCPTARPTLPARRAPCAARCRSRCARAAAGRRARHGARSGPSRTAACRLPRRRGDGIELPRRARGVGRAPCSIAPASSPGRELLGPLVLRSAANWAERGRRRAHRSDRTRRRRHGRAPPRGDAPRRAPELSRLYEALAERARALAAPGARPMKVARDQGRAARRARAARREGRTIGLVPTMGALHEGHLSLLRAARERCDVVVMSLFVNPAQFGPGEDLAAYPRDEARDLELAAAAGVDVVFAPAAEEVYPRGLRDHRRGGRGPDRAPLRRSRAARARSLPRRDHRRRQALQLGPPRRRLLRPEGRPAGDRDPPDGRATSTSRSRSPSSPPYASRTALP